MLEIENLTHIYGGGGPNEHHAIDGLDLKVAEGELLCIVGPVRLRQVHPAALHRRADLAHRRAGQLDGAPVTADARRPGRGVPGLQPLAVPLDVRGATTSRCRCAAGARPSEAAGGRAGGAGGGGPGGRRRRKYPWQLSGGMQQRVAIARALAYRPTLLLMDEPFGSVDAQTREDLEDLVLEVRRHHQMTILLVTHDIDESVYVGDRVVVLSKAPAHGRRRPARGPARAPRPDHHPGAPGLRPPARRGGPPGARPHGRRTDLRADIRPFAASAVPAAPLRRPDHAGACVWRVSACSTRVISVVFTASLDSGVQAYDGSVRGQRQRLAHVLLPRDRNCPSQPLMPMTKGSSASSK